jgi:hypothetical protein
MKYAIFSIGNARQHYIDAMHYQLGNWDQIPVWCVDGSNPQALHKAALLHKYKVTVSESGLSRVGHFGIWYTVLNALEDAPIVTFEDDAILQPNFVMEFTYRTSQLPEDADFFSLFLPRDSDHLYSPEMSVSPSLCKVYQNYGGVSMYYTEQGAKKIKALLERDGLTDQYDDQLYKYAKAGELNGYTSKPELYDLVRITGMETSIVQESEKIIAG